GGGGGGGPHVPVRQAARPHRLRAGRYGLGGDRGARAAGRVLGPPARRRAPPLAQRGGPRGTRGGVAPPAFSWHPERKSQRPVGRERSERSRGSFCRCA